MKSWHTQDWMIVFRRPYTSSQDGRDADVNLQQDSIKFFLLMIIIKNI